MIEVRRYVTEPGTDVFGEWLASLKDGHARMRIIARIDRLATGNFGDWKSLREGVCELRVDYGPGYRVYFARSSDDRILLLCGGDKRRQTADIRRAIDFLQDHRRRQT